MNIGEEIVVIFDAYFMIQPLLEFFCFENPNLFDNNYTYCQDLSDQIQQNNFGQTQRRMKIAGFLENSFD